MSDVPDGYRSLASDAFRGTEDPSWWSGLFQAFYCLTCHRYEKVFDGLRFVPAEELKEEEMVDGEIRKRVVVSSLVSWRRSTLIFSFFEAICQRKKMTILEEVFVSDWTQSTKLELPSGAELAEVQALKTRVGHNSGWDCDFWRENLFF